MFGLMRYAEVFHSPGLYSHVKSQKKTIFLYFITKLENLNTEHRTLLAMLILTVCRMSVIQNI